MALPNSEIVAVAWLKSAVSFLENRVATALPTGDEWSGKTFVTVAVVGGTPDNYVGWRRPVVSLDFWAASVDSGRPLWNLAAQAAEQTREAILDHGTVGRPVALPAAYSPARVESMVMRTEPTRVRGDVANYAHYTMDVEFMWKAL
jgi:hypothetical protein